MNNLYKINIFFLILYSFYFLNAYTNNLYINENQEKVIVNSKRLIDIYKGVGNYTLMYNFKNINNFYMDFKSDKKSDVKIKKVQITTNKINKDNLLNSYIGKTLFVKNKNLKEQGVLVSVNPILVDINGLVYNVNFKDLIFNINDVIFDTNNINKTQVDLKIYSYVKERLELNTFFELSGIKRETFYKLNILKNNTANLIKNINITNNTSFDIIGVNLFYIFSKYTDVKQFYSLKNKYYNQINKHKISILSDIKNIHKEGGKINLYKGKKNIFNVQNRIVNISYKNVIKIPKYSELINNDMHVIKYIKINNFYNKLNNNIALFENNNYVGEYKLKNNLINIGVEYGFKVEHKIINNNDGLFIRLNLKNNTQYNSYIYFEGSENIILKKPSILINAGELKNIILKIRK